MDRPAGPPADTEEPTPMFPHAPRRRVKVARLGLVAGLTAVLVAGIYFLHTVQVRRQAGVLLTRADSAAGRGDHAGAARLYQGYLNFRPKDAEALAKYADTLEELNRSKPATVHDLLKVYERLLQLDPDRADVRRKLARHYMAVEYYAAARDHLKRLTAGGPADVELCGLFAACAEREGNAAETAEWLGQAVATGKAEPETYLKLALMLKTRKEVADPERAEAVIGKLAEAYPQDVRARIGRARYRIKTGEPQRAREDVEFAYRSLPGGDTHPDVALALAELASNDAELKTAKTALEEAAKAAPEDVRLPLAAERVQLRLSDKAGATKTLQAAARRFRRPDGSLLEIADRLVDLGDVQTTAALAELFAADPAQKFLGDYLLARVRVAEGNWPAALGLFRQAIADGLPRYRTQHVKALLGEAECHRLAGNPDLRLKGFDAVLALDKANLPALLGRAECLFLTARVGEAVTAYQALTARSPTARAALCQLLIDEQTARPEADRTWAAVEEALGHEPRSAELELLRGRMLLARGRAADALALFQHVVRQTPDVPPARVALALAWGRTEPATGLAVLDRAERELGDRVDFRLARAQLFTRTANPDLPALAALAENTGAFGKAQRFRLFAELGDLFAVMGRPKEATDLLLRAAAEMPYDVNTRAAVFGIALGEGNAPLQNRMLDELRKIEGPDGPVTVVAEATRAVREVKPGDPRTAELRGKLMAVLAKRESWGRVHALLGDLDMLDGSPDTAADRYRKAADLGVQTESVVRTLVRLLLDRHGHLEALGVLNRFSRTAPLPPDLAADLIKLQAAFGEDTEKTLAWARSAEAANSKDYREQLLRAGVFAAANVPEEAHTALRKAVGLNGTAPDAWVALVQFLAATGKATEAKAAATKAASQMKPVSDRPEDRAAVETALGTCHELLGEPAKARDCYRRAVSLTPADRTAANRLYQLTARTGTRAEAEAVLDGVLKSAAPKAVKLWARRTLAFSKVDHPDGYAELSAALALIDQNLRDGGNLLDDRRAKALVLAIDPFQQPEAIALLTESAKAAPLTAEQSAQLARMYVQQGRWDLAERALRDATRAAALAAPHHLALLVKVQAASGDVEGARKTATRLKAVAPNSWESVSSAARVRAAEGNKAEAGRLIRAATENADPGLYTALIGPFLEEVGCIDAAEQVYQKVAATNQPAAHAALGSLYIRTGQAAKATALAFAHERSAPVGMTARLLAGAARCRPRTGVPVAERAEWEKTLTKIDGWVQAALRSHPADPEVLFAKAGLDDLFERYDDEVRAYEDALSHDPDNDVLLNNLATVLAVAKKDRSGRALTAIEKAIRRKGPRAAYLDTRALVHLTAGRYDAAARDLGVAVRLDPKPVYYYHLALLAHKQAEDRPELAAQRDQAWAEARRRGFHEGMLHPAEVEQFRRFSVELAGR